MKLKTDKTLEIIAVLVLVGLVFEGIYLYSHWPTGDNPFLIPETYQEPDDPVTKQPQVEPEEKLPLPEKVNLEIPFISQAPFGDWSYPFNHACEEAAVLMAHYYIAGRDAIDQAKAREELLGLVKYEEENYGLHEDTSVAQTARLIEDYYGYQAKVEYDISLDDIKRELAKGNPVIIPAAGRLLANPHFKPPGPLYHMLLVKGYNAAEFITNDPGTMWGADYAYSYQILEEAIHDLGDKELEEIIEGRSAMISVTPLF